MDDSEKKTLLQRRIRSIRLVFSLLLLACAAPSSAAQAGQSPSQRSALAALRDAPPIPSSPAIDRKRLIFHLRSGSALSCYNPNALRALSQPRARERLGDINFMALISEGRCATINNHLPLMIGPSFRTFSGVAQVHPNHGGMSTMFYVMNRDLVGFDGRPPHDIPPH